jgi:hypothetical protein
MESLNSSTGKNLAIGVVVGLLVIGVAVLFIRYNDTRPLVQGFADMVRKYTPTPAKPTIVHPKTENFVAANGVGLYACSQESAEGAELFSIFMKHDGSADAKQDLRNLRNLLAKLSCMKRDLLSPSGIISAENELRFTTQSDIQPLADTTSRCLSKQIPERDLNIQFEKWQAYGLDLIRRLCTDYNIEESQVVEAERLFGNMYADVYVVAKSKCLGVESIAPKSSRLDPKGITPNDVKNLGVFDGFSSEAKNQ